MRLNDWVDDAGDWGSVSMRGADVGRPKGLCSNPRGAGLGRGSSSPKIPAGIKEVAVGLRGAPPLRDRISASLNSWSWLKLSAVVVTSTYGPGAKLARLPN